MRTAIILLLFSLANSSCSKKVTEHRYTAEEFTHLAHLATLVNSTGENAIPFSDYSSGVNKINSKTLIFERLKFYAVEFETETLARNEALRLNQYYSRNILFDRVEGEPVLEDYIIKTFQAKNPNRAIQRTSKKEDSPHAEHGAHEESHDTHSTHQ